MYFEPLVNGASPGLTVGRGLKPSPTGFCLNCGEASPGLTVGRGLKLVTVDTSGPAAMHRPASRSGAD